MCLAIIKFKNFPFFNIYKKRVNKNLDRPYMIGYCSSNHVEFRENKLPIHYPQPNSKNKFIADVSVLDFILNAGNKKTNL